MATHRTIPGAHLSTADAGATPQDRKDATGDLGTELPGSTGIGSGLGAETSGFGAADSLATPPAADDREPFAAGDAGRQYPRAVGVLDQVKQQASTRVNEQKVRAAAGLGSMASAIRQASDHLRSENQTLAAYADRAVDQIEGFADRMRDTDPAEMMRDVEQFARRNPAAFVGGAFLLGMGLARFLKSSGSAEHGRDGERSHRHSGFGARPDGVGPIVAGARARAESSSQPSTVPSTPAPGVTS